MSAGNVGAYDRTNPHPHLLQVLVDGLVGAAYIFKDGRHVLEECLPTALLGAPRRDVQGAGAEKITQLRSNMRVVKDLAFLHDRGRCQGRELQNFVCMVLSRPTVAGQQQRRQQQSRAQMEHWILNGVPPAHFL